MRCGACSEDLLTRYLSVTVTVLHVIQCHCHMSHFVTVLFCHHDHHVCDVVVHLSPYVDGQCVCVCVLLFTLLVSVLML